MITYRGLPAPLVCDHISRSQSRSYYSPGTEFQIGRIEMVSHTGTYIDSPFHRFAEGADLAALPLDRLSALPAVLVDASSGSGAIDRRLFAGRALSGRAIIIRTGWDRHWRTDRYFEGHPFLTEAAAAYLRDQGAALVGIDSLNIDDTSGGSRPVHTILLGAGIPIVEHLTALGGLPESGFEFSAVPPKIVGMGTFPVRAYARLTAA